MRIPVPIYQAMVVHSQFELPNEACGLLAADAGGELRMGYCLTNADSSPVSYTIDPMEQFRAIQHAERNGWDVVGAFHSHPRGPAVPSSVDRRLALDPDWVYVVVGQVEARNPEVKAYRIRDGAAIEEPVSVY